MITPLNSADAYETAYPLLYMEAGRRIKKFLLTEGEKCGCDLLEQLQIGQPTLSHHMKNLCDCGLVTARKAAKWSYYSLVCDQWTEFRDFIDAIRCTCACDGKTESGCCCS